MLSQPAATLQYIFSWGGNKHTVLEKEESVKDAELLYRLLNMILSMNERFKKNTKIEISGFST